MKHSATETYARIATLILALFLATPALADAMNVYLALGDSLAFGVTNITPVSFGDQGYVSLYADFLASQANGLRPQVVNLAVPGETGTGFFTAVSPFGLPPHDLLSSVNLNYHGDGALSQDALLLNTLAGEAAAGRTITNVTFALGSNDVTAFIALHPDFLTLPSDQQQQLITAFFDVLGNNYILVLSQLRAALPDARILLLNYCNPFAGFPPDDAFNIANTIFDQGQTSLINGLAGPFHASVVDINAPFRGHENEPSMTGGRSLTRMKIGENAGVGRRSAGVGTGVSSETKLAGSACGNPRLVRRPV
jgi:lysophospholipase L1-like esterase